MFRRVLIVGLQLSLLAVGFIAKATVLAAV